MAIILDGKSMAAELMEGLKARVNALKAHQQSVGLAVILVGDDPASQVYVRNKGRACEELGIYSETIRLPENTSQAEVEALIDRLNADDRFHGILVQLPLPGAWMRRRFSGGSFPKRMWTASISKTRVGSLPARAA